MCQLIHSTAYHSIKFNQILLFTSRYSIGNSDLINGIEYGWLYTLANISQQPYTQTVSFNEDNETISNIEFMGGPSRKTMYVTALYYTMTCMTSVGFGNVAAETDNEKIFSICMMIVAGMKPETGNNKIVLIMVSWPQLCSIIRVFK